jgi:hypothetical protein
MVVQLLSNVRAVVGGRIIEAATVASEDGRILSIEENRSSVSPVTAVTGVSGGRYGNRRPAYLDYFFATACRTHAINIFRYHV